MLGNNARYGGTTMGRLTGKSAIITGAAQGIGAAYAKGLAAEGAKVSLCDLTNPSRVVDEIRGAGGEAIGQPCDITNPEDVSRLMRGTYDEFGGIDILVNNAALFGTLALKPFDQITSEEWDRVMVVNTRGPFECIKAVTPYMKEKQYGKIINVTSSGVFKGIPMLLHYVTSKAAVIGLTRSVARELGGFGIRVNVLAPGLTVSEMVKGNAAYDTSRELNVGSRALKREQVPEDLVGTVVFLASSDSDFMTGQTVLVDGGSAML
jgi:NAD(P)-dependent dehydrogenase (short-subunit alcohol dehydrogenase family)